METPTQVGRHSPSPRPPSQTQTLSSSGQSLARRVPVAQAPGKELQEARQGVWGLAVRRRSVPVRLHGAQNLQNYRSL